jgi:hypothetical protein
VWPWPGRDRAEPRSERTEERGQPSSKITPGRASHEHVGVSSADHPLKLAVACSANLAGGRQPAALGSSIFHGATVDSVA